VCMALIKDRQLGTGVRAGQECTPTSSCPSAANRPVNLLDGSRAHPLIPPVTGRPSPEEGAL
jgi:hypothetical protein